LSSVEGTAHLRVRRKEDGPKTSLMNFVRARKLDRNLRGSREQTVRALNQTNFAKVNLTHLGLDVLETYRIYHLTTPSTVVVLFLGIDKPFGK
jgi:hypothetical protein